MIFKKMNIGNRNTYDCLIIDSISDTVGNIAILKNNADYDPEPYVIVYGYDLDDGTWKYGNYYGTLEQAKNQYYKKIK